MEGYPADFGADPQAIIPFRIKTVMMTRPHFRHGHDPIWYLRPDQCATCETVVQMIRDPSTDPGRMVR